MKTSLAASVNANRRPTPLDTDLSRLGNPEVASRNQKELLSKSPVSPGQDDSLGNSAAKLTLDRIGSLRVDFGFELVLRDSG